MPAAQILCCLCRSPFIVDWPDQSIARLLQKFTEEADLKILCKECYRKELARAALS